MTVPDESSATVRFDGEADDFVEVRLVDASSDLLVEVETRRVGFRGVVETWVLREAWMGFVQELAALEATRQGEARVASISPGEMALVVRAVDKSGHMAVAGQLGVRSHDTEVNLDFSPMGFDPSLLPQIARSARTFVA